MRSKARPIATTVGIEDYEVALEKFLADVDDMGSGAISVLIHGSMACGTVRPGQSDIMDAHIVVEPGLLEEKERYLECLASMVVACEHLAETEIPFHPFCYLGRDEMDCIHSAPFSIFPVEPFMTVAKGIDVMKDIKETETSRELGKTYFYEARSAAFFRLARFLKKKRLTESDCEQMFAVLMSVKKSLSMVFLALGIGIERVDKLNIKQDLEKVLPDVDTSVIDDIGELQRKTQERHEAEGQAAGANAIVSKDRSEEVLALARRTMQFLENLHERIIGEEHVGSFLVEGQSHTRQSRKALNV